MPGGELVPVGELLVVLIRGGGQGLDEARVASGPASVLHRAAVGAAGAADGPGGQFGRHLQPAPDQGLGVLDADAEVVGGDGF